MYRNDACNIQFTLQSLHSFSTRNDQQNKSLSEGKLLCRLRSFLGGTVCWIESKSDPSDERSMCTCTTTITTRGWKTGTERNCDVVYVARSEERNTCIVFAQLKADLLHPDASGLWSPHVRYWESEGEFGKGSKGWDRMRPVNVWVLYYSYRMLWVRAVTSVGLVDGVTLLILVTVPEAGWWRHHACH